MTKAYKVHKGECTIHYHKIYYPHKKCEPLYKSCLWRTQGGFCTNLNSHRYGTACMQVCSKIKKEKKSIF